MINVILATDKNSLVGKDNLLPWHYSEDLKYFKAKTKGKKIIMGEATFNSIIGYNGHPLKYRENVVCSLSDFSYPGVEVTNDIFGYLESHKEEDMFVIGGKTIYNLIIPICDYLYVTHIDAEHDGNQYLHIDYSKFTLVEETKSGILTFAKYQRNK